MQFHTDTVLTHIGRRCGGPRAWQQIGLRRIVLPYVLQGNAVLRIESSDTEALVFNSKLGRRRSVLIHVLQCNAVSRIQCGDAQRFIFGGKFGLRCCLPCAQLVGEGFVQYLCSVL